MLYNSKYNLEEPSSGHKGESLLSDSLESSDDKDEDDDRTGAKDINCDGDGNGGDEENTGNRGVSAEWLRFLSLIARMEALGAMENSKASSLTASREKTNLGKSNSKIVRK